MFVASRLKIARQRRGFKNRELAEMAGLAPVTVSRIENQKHKPDADSVLKLAKALRFPEGYFYKSDPEEVTKETVSFRSMRAITAAERDAAISVAPFAIELCHWIEERFNLPQADLPDFSSERSPAAAATSLRQHWILGEQPIPNMIKLLESKGVKIFPLTEKTSHLDGYSLWNGNTPFIFLNTFKTAERSIFDCAHELGHLILHRHGGSAQGQQAEDEANAFASAFLMPEADVRAHIPHFVSLEYLIQAKKRWRVSVSALAYRLHKLEILTDWHYRRLCISMQKRGYRKNEPESIEREKSVLLEKVMRLLWNDKIHSEMIAKELNFPQDELEALLTGFSMPLKQEERQRGTQYLRVL